MSTPQDKLAPERDGSGPSSLRIAIIGGGAAGLVAADELRRLGYQHVTVYEEEARAGGKTLSYPNPAGGVWELGTVWLSEGYDVMDELASRFHVSLNVDRRPLRFLPTASPAEGQQEVHAFFPYALRRYSVVEVVGSVLHFWKIVHAHPFLKQPGFQVRSFALSFSLVTV
jgi:NADPH-dependent 2,4-dienoyl-CoA reductase/sulfur reductase-like enzyme